MGRVTRAGWFRFSWCEVTAVGLPAIQAGRGPLRESGGRKSGPSVFAVPFREKTWTTRRGGGGAAFWARRAALDVCRDLSRGAVRFKQVVATIPSRDPAKSISLRDEWSLIMPFHFFLPEEVRAEVPQPPPANQPPIG